MYISAIIILNLDDIDLQHLGVGIIRWDEMVKSHTVIIDLSAQIKGSAIGHNKLPPSEEVDAYSLKWAFPTFPLHLA